MLRPSVGINNGFLLSLLLISHIALAANPASAVKPNHQPKIPEKSVQDAGKVNLNTADAATLAAKLKGVGLKKAQAIVEYREKYGLFSDINQLQEVPGFGESLVNRNLALLSI